MNPYNLTFRKSDVMAISEVHFSAENQSHLDQFFKEYMHQGAISKYNIPVNNKILLHGHTGCGKTTTANAIAKELGKQIFIVNLSNLVSSKLGETAINFASICQKAIKNEGVLFIDEFDSIGKVRDYDDKDSGEMKRLVNTIIQQIDYFPENLELIAATNQYKMIDTALLRRFQLKLEFELPSQQQLDHYYNTLLLNLPDHFKEFDRVYAISFAEAKDYFHKVMKEKIIFEEELKTRKSFKKHD